MDSGSYQQFAEGYFLAAAGMAWFWDQYLPDESRRSEILASPVRASSEELAVPGARSSDHGCGDDPRPPGAPNESPCDPERAGSRQDSRADIRRRARGWRQSIGSASGLATMVHSARPV
jgi:hypothetical protein